VYLKWTGPNAGHDLYLAVLISAVVGFAAGAVARRRRALLVALGGPAAYAAMLVASPDYRVADPLLYAILVSAILAATCAAGIAIGRAVRAPQERPS
jgi:hypothetical protein